MVGKVTVVKEVVDVLGGVPARASEEVSGDLKSRVDDGPHAKRVIPLSDKAVSGDKAGERSKVPGGEGEGDWRNVGVEKPEPEGGNEVTWGWRDGSTPFVHQASSSQLAKIRD